MAPGILSRILRLFGTPLRFGRRLYITELLLAHKGGCNTDRHILRSWLFTNVVSCNASMTSYEKRIEELLVTIQAQVLEESLKSLRATLSDYQKLAEQMMQQTGIINDPLRTYQVAIAPLAIITKTFKEAKDQLQGLKEASYSMTEIMELAERPLLYNPLSLIHERKKHIKARAQVDLAQKLILLTRKEENIRRRLLTCSNDAVSHLFIQ
jgi:hypothetical protein